MVSSIHSGPTIEAVHLSEGFGLAEALNDVSSQNQRGIIQKERA